MGACCRAIKTMGLNRLVLVGAENINMEEALMAAIHAGEVLENASRYDTLTEALKGTALSAGITRRRGTKRKWFSILPEELAQRSSSLNGRTALVFGNERTGLDDEELNTCNLACHIPSSPEFPSLNLSHAVQIVSSAFWRQALNGATGGYNPIPREDIDNLVDVIHSALDAMGYFKAADRFHTDRYFRDILARAALSTREARHLEKVFRKLQYLRRN